MDENILDHLITEHDEMREMMGTLEQEYDEKTFKQFGQELEKHQEAEEEVLYSRLKNDSEIRDLVLEGIEEHHAATQLLRKLQEQKAGTETWMAKMKVLKESVEHHLEHEETEMFPQVQTIIPENEAIALTKEFESAKKRVKAHA